MSKSDELTEAINDAVDLAFNHLKKKGTKKNFNIRIRDPKLIDVITNPKSY